LPLARRLLTFSTVDEPLSIAFLKDRYDFELDRKDKLTASLTLPVGCRRGVQREAPQVYNRGGRHK
jgi:hypothetical protein